MIALRKGEPSLEVLQYQVNPWQNLSKLRISTKFSKISLIFWAPLRNRIRY